MKSRIKKMGETVVVVLDGKVDYETQEPFRQKIQSLIPRGSRRTDTVALAHTDSVPLNVVFDLQGLEFVGSSGITNFIQTLKDFSNRAGIRPQCCNVTSEFQKIIRAFDEEAAFDFLEGDWDAGQLLKKLPVQ